MKSCPFLERYDVFSVVHKVLLFTMGGKKPPITISNIFWSMDFSRQEAVSLFLIAEQTPMHLAPAHWCHHDV